MSHSTLVPKDHAEEVALFRSEIVGALSRKDLVHGELAESFRELSQERFRPPGADKTKTFPAPTLERWYYRYREGGLDALRPEPRSDRGRAHDLKDEQRQLLIDIRTEHPSASVPLILRTLVLDGRLDKDAVSAATIRRLYREHGLGRAALEGGAGRKTRLRWQAERPGILWHGDVCYGPSLVVGESTFPLRIHALMDDASRFVLALEAFHTEREIDMLGMFAAALRRHGAPEALYLDNGSTYSGDALRPACERLSITLIHAVSVGGKTWELDQGFLAGRLITVSFPLLDDETPFAEPDGKRLPLFPTDPVKSSRREPAGRGDLVGIRAASKELAALSMKQTPDIYDC